MSSQFHTRMRPAQITHETAVPKRLCEKHRCLSKFSPSTITRLVREAVLKEAGSTQKAFFSAQRSSRGTQATQPLLQFVECQESRRTEP